MTRTLLCVALVGGVLLAGCGKTAEQKKLEEMAQKAGEAGKALQEGSQGIADAMRGLGDAAKDGKKVEPVDFRELKAMLPEKLSGMTREGAEGEKTSAMGVKISEAHANYTAAEGAHVSVKIVDMGSVSGLVGMATMAWAAADVDRETENGYEKTTTFDGHKAFEKYDNQSHSGELNILVEKRFVVTIEGNDVAMSFLKEAARSIDLGKLASMKNAGVTS
jgi:hypothetical protein